jgi:aspartate/methionine/tyrosine aminotransferase
MGYTVALGLPALRARIAELYGQWYDIDLAPDRVIVTPGSSGAFILAFTALFDTGARVGIGAPGYPSYRQILKALDLVPVDIETTAENRLQPVPEDLRGRDLDGLLVASPANPSGTMLDRPAMSALMQATTEQRAVFISDEIYHGIEYETKAVSALEISDDCYVINSFSKYFSMTGWRYPKIMCASSSGWRRTCLSARHMSARSQRLRQWSANRNCRRIWRSTAPIGR